MSDIAAIILAAGLASRYRAADPLAVSKVVALLDGKPLVRHVAETALAAGLAPVVVVTGHAQEAVHGALAGLDLRFVHNTRFAEGMADSLKAGVAALPDHIAGAVVLLADMPRVSQATIGRLAAAFAQSAPADAIVPVAGGRRGNPVLLGRALFAAVAKLSGDEGARRLLNDPRFRIVEVAAGEDTTLDIDTPEALRDAERNM